MERWFWGIPLIAVTALWFCISLIFDLTPPLKFVTVIEISLIALALLGVMNRVALWLHENRWKNLFLEAFPEINLGAMEKTVAKINADTKYGYPRTFYSVAKAVVTALQDEWDCDTLLRNEFQKYAKETYRSFLPKET